MPVRDDPVAFVDRLRRAGIAVPVSATIAYREALDELGVDRPDDVYWAGRATLLTRREDLDAYDRCFAELVLGGAAGPADERLPTPVAAATGADEGAPHDGQADDGDGEHDRPERTVRWSRVEVLAHRDLRTCTAEELAELDSVVAGIRLDAPRRRSARSAPTPRHAPAIDLGATARDAVRHGEVLRLHRRRRVERPRRAVLLLDVSGSMEPYARTLLRFGHAAVRSRRPVEVFTIGTRLTRLTRELHDRDADAALRAVSSAVPDLSGGTRLGEAVRSFVDGWGARGAARGADVVIVSDGWDRGDPEVLAAAMARLRRLARRTVWANPLRASPGYEPLARGMAAALPFVDDFVDGHSVASLRDLADLLAGGRPPVASPS